MFKQKNKRGFVFYGRFLTTRMMTTPMTAMNANNPAIAGMKYCSEMDGGDSVGCGVVGTSSTPIAVCADDE